MKGKRIFKEFLMLLWSFFLFFGLIAFVVTCSILLFFSGARLPEEDIRAIAPIVFGNVILLSLLFVIVDRVRRRLTVERPAEQIQGVLNEMQRGNFHARVGEVRHVGADSQFADIAKSVDLLGEELCGVEALRDDFVANVSHEMKTPLAVIGNYAALLQSPDLGEEERETYTKGILDATGRLSETVTNILRLDRLENQQIYPNAVRFDLSEQLADCILQFESVWEQKQIELELSIEEGVMICGDPELLQPVWSNLLSNAFKFTEEGGRVSVFLEREHESVAVTVADSGCGMSAEVGAHIFEKFYQGDSSHATSGNGLGLALVKRVMDIVGGEITVESRVGEGSLFIVRLQVKDEGSDA